jgi:cell division protein FtsZ
MNICVSPDVALEDAELASTLIAQEANPEANIIWGVTFDSEMDDEMKITIIATGFEKKPEDAERKLKVKTNDNSPDDLKQKTVAGTVFGKPVAPKAVDAEAKKPVQQKVEPKKPAKADDEDGYDDLLDMFSKTK